MGLFDWIPTAEEVFEFVECRLTGHTWQYFTTDNGVYRICDTCKKKEKV